MVYKEGESGFSGTVSTSDEGLRRITSKEAIKEVAKKMAMLNTGSHCVTEEEQ